MQLRPYQQDLDDGIVQAWDAGARTVMAVAPTGAGKTVLFSHRLKQEDGVRVAIAHRSELVGQMSGALAKSGVPHNIIAAKATVAEICRANVQDTGATHYNPRSLVHVASVDTLLRREVPKGCKLWVIDEGHHLLKENKWGRAVQALGPQAKGLAVTATPIRADGKGLGSHADGLVDSLVEGPTMRTLIDSGYLTEYRIFCPPSDLDLADVGTGSTGDYKNPQLRAAVKRSHIMGDVVNSYLKFAKGKRGVTFAVDVESAGMISEQFQGAGVPSQVVSAKTPASLRAAILRDFREGRVLQLVNVDLFGEGFDLPALEVVSMARPTQSFALFAQQFGRALRTLDGKDKAIIIDHVQNIVRHGLPDAPRAWSLDRREKRSKGDAGPGAVRVCAECTGAYERVLKVCPYCGAAYEPPQRSAPEFVDGDLTELDEATLARMRGEVARVDAAPRFPANAKPVVVASIKKKHAERQRIQGVLRDQIAIWAGGQRNLQRPDDESYRRFYLAFGIDVLSAQALGAREAGELAERVRDAIQLEQTK